MMSCSIAGVIVSPGVKLNTPDLYLYLKLSESMSRSVAAGSPRSTVGGGLRVSVPFFAWITVCCTQ